MSSGHDDDDPAEQQYDWSAHYDDSGGIYYYNEKTDESRWDEPPDGYNSVAQHPSTGNNNNDNDNNNNNNNDSWQALQDEEGATYYYNTVTEETTWDKPNGFQDHNKQKDADEEDINEDKDNDNDDDDDDAIMKDETEQSSSKNKNNQKWSKHTDDDGNVYYFNEITEETQWDKPEDYASDAHNDTNDDNDHDVDNDHDADNNAQATATTAKKNSHWTKHHDDDGNIYYYNEKTEETQWDKPEDYNDDDDDDGNDDNNEKQNAVKKEEETTKISDDGDSKSGSGNNNNKRKTEKAVVPVSKWTKHEDDEGNVYYYNEETEETQWDRPEDYASDANNDDGGGDAQNQDARKKEEGIPSAADGSSSSSSSKKRKKIAVSVSKWTKHEDDEGNVYYYNEETEETQWDKPEDYASDANNDDDDDDAKPDENQKIRIKGDGNNSTTSTKKRKKSAPVSKWTKHEDDEGNVYYYNEETEETQWDRPDDYASDANNDNDGEDDDITSTKDDSNRQQPRSKWTKHQDDDGNEYYYNEETEETQWDRPDDYVDFDEEGPESDATPKDGSETKVKKKKQQPWAKHYDEEGNEYYYNEITEETQWEKPEDYEDESTTTTTTAKDETQKGEPQEEKKDEEDASAVTQKEEPPEPEPEPEPEIDPAVKKLQDAENALNQRDAIMEPGCLGHVGELLSSLGGAEGGQKAMQSLLSSYHGDTSICGLLGLWLTELKGGDFRSSADSVRKVTQDLIFKLAKERFTAATGDKIFNLARSEATFLDEMMVSPIWRKLLIDLSATHRDSQLLSFCLSNISKMGHHREIAGRINQSDHFPVYNAMLASEFAVVGIGGESEGIRMAGLLENLRRTCTSTSYTYFYAMEALSFLVKKAEEQNSPVIAQATRKWIRLREELENAMVDPNVSAQTAGSSSLFRKRRREIALTISELQQRQRRRLRPSDDDNDDDDMVDNNIDTDEQMDSIESALASLLLRHAENKKLDDELLDKLLSVGVDGRVVGMMLNHHPLAIRSLLGHLFRPGSSRISSLLSRSKCARLISMAVMAAEKTNSKERSVEEPQERNQHEEDIKSSLLQGSQLCELVENMVSFSVTSELEHKETNQSAGIKLCIFSMKSAPVAQGVVMWADELVSGSEFISSASYPTLSPSILSLLRIISERHTFARPIVLKTALAYLRHSNSDISYQKLNELKQQALRLLLCLLVRGQVAPVLDNVAIRLKKSGSSELDASLVRYFVGALLDTVEGPYTVTSIRAFTGLLTADRCIDALKSTYFSEGLKSKLMTMIGSFKEAATSGSTSKDTAEKVANLVKIYVD